MHKTDNADNEHLLGAILEGVQRKKGYDIVKVDLTVLENTFCQFFVICHGNTNVQVGAIAESVEEKVKDGLQLKPWHREGLENAQWVLLDYGDIVVHIFQKEYRDFYNLEELWADAIVEQIVEKDIGVNQK
jgi:ribosome-associated protein